MPDPVDGFLKCGSDPFTEVRDHLGNLLGCVPKVPDNVDTIMDANGRAFPMMIAGRACVYVREKASPIHLAGFVPLNADVDLAMPAPGTDGDPIAPDGTDPDLAREP
jgi:hypothetical protein